MLWRLLLFAAPLGSSADLFWNGSDVSIPLTVNFGLLGFNADGAWQLELNAGDLHRLLQRLLPTRRPSCGQDGMPMDAEYNLQYNVVLMQTGLSRLLQTLSSALRPADDAGDPSMLQYVIEVADIEDHFDLLISSYFMGSQHAEQTHSAGTYTVLILNPNKSDMAQRQGLPRHFNYYYRYRGGVPTQMFIGRGRYLVIDLSAGPVDFGLSQESGEGAVSAASLPRVFAELHGGEEGRAARASSAAAQAAFELAHASFVAQLASVLTSAIRHVFAPDLATCTLETFETLVLPIIVLRDHKLFDPLKPGHARSIDVAAIKGEVRELLLPHQKVVAMPSLHELFDHPQISVAVTRAQQADTVHELGPGGSLVTKAKPYLEAEGLANHLRHSVDWLAGGLLSAGTGRHMAAAAGARSPGLGEGGSDESESTRVLPIYVFSLAGADRELLLNQLSLVHWSSDAVLVLQTDAQSLTVPFFSQSAPLVLSPADPTRHILAGIAGAVGALLPPFESFTHGKLAVDFLWSTGYHPFGPFANTRGLSPIFAETSQRHAVLTSLQASLGQLQAAAAAAEAFIVRYMHAAIGDSPAHRIQLATQRQGLGGELNEQRAGQLLRRVVAGEVELTAERVQLEMIRLGRKVATFNESVAEAIEQLREHRLYEAHQAASSLWSASVAFASLVEEGLADLQRELECCSIHHGVEPDFHLKYLLAVLLVGLALYGVAIYVAAPPTKPGQRRQ